RVEQRELTEHLAGAEDRQQVLATVARPAAQLDLALRDDVEPVARLALAEEHVTPDQLHGHHGLEERARLLAFHVREEGGREYDVVVHQWCPHVSGTFVHQSFPPLSLPQCREIAGSSVSLVASAWRT